VIRLENRFTIAASPHVIWPLLSDPVLVASCIPGATLKEKESDGKYRGELAVKFGPTVAVFSGVIKMEYDHAAHRCTVEGHGRDRKGASRATASAEFVATGTDSTLVSMTGGFAVSGPLETFARAGGTILARALMEEFAKNLSLHLHKTGDAGASRRSVPAAPAALGVLSLLGATLAGWLARVFARLRG
jgi:carbon monoxide dehydrogenase subunit G